MTNLAILSDIHGNLAALEAVLADAARAGVDGYIVAGDIVAGPQPNEVLQQLNACKTWMIQGNNEVALLGYAKNTLPGEYWTYQQFGFARCSYRLMDAASLAMIQALPEQRVVALEGVSPLRVVHGSPRRIDEGLFPVEDPLTFAECLALTLEPVLVCGHTHLPWVVQQNGKIAVNPGAVTGNLNGDPRSGYALLRWTDGSWQVELRAIRYDVARTEQAFRESGLLEEGGAFSRACLASFHSGQNTPLEFVNFTYALARKTGWEGSFLPDEFWQIAEDRFDWDYACAKLPGKC
jgi:putative phosphoesterase